ncbi:stage V sporulation protein B [Neobacillus cucumis]|uniref:stage V sporulation protein B n=1 Tax=Neobacillus cucumis TaxID=1740721 RepID=UPI001965E5F4|nr:stage V sporulation protein B [Neobacillus cucumis]MBM7651796.1 stage V sporulation protein B [Neobacillus cucumis]
MSKFLRGTFILLVAGFITRVLGFIYRIVLARSIGEEGVGLYMMAYPTFILVVTVIQLGLPVAISKNIAEAEAKGDYAEIKKILIVSLAITIGLSIILTPALILLAPILSTTLFTDSRTYYPLIAIAPALPIIAIASVLRGYFQGRQNMRPSAVSQILEQLVRITLIATATKTFLPYGVEYGAAAAMGASVLGELLSLVYLLTTFKLKKRFKLRKNFFQFVQKGQKTFKDLMGIALPTMGSRMIGSISWFFEPIVVAHSLALAGVVAVNATKQYGALTGYAMPLLMLPSFVTFSLATSLVPAISEANSKNKHKQIEYRLQQALRFVFLSGGLAVILLYVLADPLMQLMYGSTKGAYFIRLMAPFMLIFYYQGPLQAVLQALNLARAAMINSLIGAIVKTAVIFVLASQPSFGITGAALGIVVGFVLVTGLHFATVLKKVAFSFYIRDYLKGFLCMGAAGWMGYWLYHHYFLGHHLAIRVVTAALMMMIAYLLLLVIFRLIKKEELKRIPWIGNFIVLK